MPTSWQGVATVAAVPATLVIALLGLKAVSALAVLIGMPVVVLACIWLFGVTATRRLQPPSS